MNLRTGISRLEYRFFEPKGKLNTSSEYNHYMFRAKKQQLIFVYNLRTFVPIFTAELIL
jgi:hypothetical protein